MSLTTSPQSPVRRSPRGRSPARRALGVEFRLEADQFRGMLVLCAALLVISVLWTDVITFLAGIWAALSWYRYGRTDSPQHRALVAGLGLSRGDRLRARVLLVIIESLVLIAAGALGGIIAQWRGHGSEQILADQGMSAPVQVVLYILGTAVTLLVVALGVGKECMTRRPSGVMFGITMLVYIAGVIVSGALTATIGWIRWTETGPTQFIPRPLGIAVSLAVVVVLAAVLAWRVRAWVRSLDEPGAGARRTGPR